MLFMYLGSKIVHYFNDETNEIGVWSADEMFERTLELPSGSIIIGEAAHFGTPRTRASKAQYWYEQALLDWYSDLEKAGIRLYLAPEKETYKYRLKLNVDKKDLADLMALQLSVTLNGLVNLKKPVKTFKRNSWQLDAIKARKEWGGQANDCRTLDYCDKEDKASKFLYDNILEFRDRLRPETCEIMGLVDENFYWKGSSKKRKATKGDFRCQEALLKESNIRTAAVMSMVLCVIDWDGNIRLRESTGEQAGWRFIKDEIIMTKPYRPKKAGTIRSNCQYHGLKHYTSSVLGNKRGQSFKPLSEYTDDEVAERKVTVKNWNTALKDMFMTLKAMAKEKL